MPQDPGDLVVQRIETALGMLEVDLPRGAELRADPGVVEGSAWFWTPQRGVVLTISEGAAGLRTPDALLALERSLDAVEVDVRCDEPGDRPGERSLAFRSAFPAAPDPSGARGRSESTVHRPAQLARFRFWQRSPSAVRLGYRLDEASQAGWQATLDRIVDGARWR